MTDRKPHVLFLLQRAESWINIASVYHALSDSGNIRATIWQLPYNVADPETCRRRDPQTRALLESEGVPYIVWHEDMSIHDGVFDVAVFCHPYDRERPKSLAFDHVASAVPATVYIPYGLPMGGGKLNLWLQYGQPTQIRASAIIARSPVEKSQYAKYCPSGDRHVHVTGLPRFDRLLADLTIQPPPEWIEFIGGRTAILWNSHFSFAPEYFQNLNFSTFDLIGPELFELALRRRSEFCLIWRPHPGLWPVLFRHGLLDKEGLQRLRNELVANGILLDEIPQHATSYRVSDALLTDVGSFLVEYIVTGKPMLALKNPDGEPLNEESKMLMSFYPQAASIQEIEEFIDRVIDSRQPPPDKKIVAYHLPLLDGNAGLRVAEVIAELCNSSVEFCADTRDLCDTSPPSSASNISMKFSLEHISTPALDHLCRGLRIMRNKKMQGSWKQKYKRKLCNKLRTEINIWFENHPRVAVAVKRFLGRQL